MIEQGGIFFITALTAGEDERNALVNAASFGKTTNIITILLIPLSYVGPTLPVIIATCQYLLDLSNSLQKEINFCKKVNFLSLLLILSSALVVGSRSLILYPLLLYSFTYSFLQNEFPTKHKIIQPNKKRIKFGKKVLSIIAIVLSGVVIVLLGVLRSSGNNTVTSSLSQGDPLSDSFLNIFTYFFYGFDILNARVEALQANHVDYSLECTLRVIIPYIHRLGPLFGLQIPEPEDCLAQRFQVYGYTASTYLTFTPIDNIFLLSLVLFILGFVWGWAFIYRRNNALAFSLFVLITVGMFFGGFTNTVVRDFAVGGTIFITIMLTFITKTSKGEYNEI